MDLSNFVKVEDNFFMDIFFSEEGDKEEVDPKKDEIEMNVKSSFYFLILY